MISILYCIGIAPVHFILCAKSGDWKTGLIHYSVGLALLLSLRSLKA
jgi:hypothetical protein